MVNVSVTHRIPKDLIQGNKDFSQGAYVHALLLSGIDEFFNGNRSYPVDFETLQIFKMILCMVLAHLPSGNP